MIKRELLGKKRGLGGEKRGLGGMGHEEQRGLTAVRTHKIKDGFLCVLIHASRPSVTVCEVAGLQRLHRMNIDPDSAHP